MNRMLSIGAFLLCSCPVLAARPPAEHEGPEVSARAREILDAIRKDAARH